MKNLYLIIVIILINGCKGQNEEKNQNNILSNKAKDETIKVKLEDVRKNDTLIINDDAITILLYPSEKEIDSLKKKWGEDLFYLSADGENGYSSSIFKLLKEKKEKYISTDKNVIYFKASKSYFNKKDINNAWGVITYKDNKYTFRNSIEFLSKDEIIKPSSIIKSNSCEISEVSGKFNFLISKYGEDPTSESVQIEIKNKKKSTYQKIIYSFNSLLSDEIPCNPISYFNNKFKIDEGIETYHSFIIGDFNFDGLEDFAYLWDSGGNGGASFTYFFQNKKEEFIKAKDFPLQEGYFPKEINKDNKTLKLI